MIELIAVGVSCFAVGLWVGLIATSNMIAKVLNKRD